MYCVKSNLGVSVGQCSNFPPHVFFLPQNFISLALHALSIRYLISGSALNERYSTAMTCSLSFLSFLSLKIWWMVTFGVHFELGMLTIVPFKFLYWTKIQV